MKNNYKPPQSLIRKIKQTAPSRSIDGDRRGYYGGGSEETFSSFESVLIYIQKGLGNYSELIKEIVKLILKVQKGGGRKYPLVPMSFGNEQTLTHERKYFDLGYINDSYINNQILQALIRLSNTKQVNPAVFPELFPKTDIRSLYSGKTKVTDKDLLVIIGKKDQVFFEQSIEPKLKLKIRKHILFVEIEDDKINWIFKNYFPLFITPKNKTMHIKRFFSENNLERIKKDFKFLIKLINTSYGEFDFAIRDNYFNIYYKGNSLAKVEPKKNDFYKVSINTKFFDKTKADTPTFYTSKKDSDNIVLTNKQLHRFFQRKHLTEFASRIKKVHNGEEIDFEQSLITDNLNRVDFIFIDRQVTDTKLKRKRLDLLALKQVEGNQYKFVVSEVKLGNNSELKGKVASQLDRYVEHIKDNFDSYKICYEKQFEQKRELGLIKSPTISKINIIKPVEGIILVGGYSGIAIKQIDELKKIYSHLEVKQFTNEI